LKEVRGTKQLISLQNRIEKCLIKDRELWAKDWKRGLLTDRSWGVVVKPLIHFSKPGDSYFRAHPLQTVFSLVAAFVLAVLAVLILAVPAK